jgi:hypothetical protein
VRQDRYRSLGPQCRSGCCVHVEQQCDQRRPVHWCQLTGADVIGQRAAVGGRYTNLCAMSISSERLARPDAIELISDSTGPGVAALRSEAISLRSRLQRIAVEFADDDTVTPAQFRAITSRLRARLDALEAHIADAGRVSVLGPFITAASEDRQAAIERVRGVWDAMLEQGTDRCRAVIDTLMTITLHSPGPGARRFDPATIEIVPKEQW